MTIEQVKERVLTKITEFIDAPKEDSADAIDIATGWANVYGILCSTETMCKCPTREDDGTLNLGELDT